MGTLAIIAVGLLFAFALAALSAWVLMILLGILAALTGWPVALGFWVCFVITAIIGLFLRN